MLVYFGAIRTLENLLGHFALSNGTLLLVPNGYIFFPTLEVFVSAFKFNVVFRFFSSSISFKTNFLIGPTLHFSKKKNEPEGNCIFCFIEHDFFNFLCPDDLKITNNQNVSNPQF